MATIYQVGREHRKAYLALEAASVQQIIDAYGHAYSIILRQLYSLLADMASASESGQRVGISWLHRQERLEVLLDQVAVEIAKVARLSNGVITGAQSQAVATAIVHAEQLAATGTTGAPTGNMASIGVQWNRVPIEALRMQVGYLGDGSPLSRLLTQLPGQASAAFAEGLTEGVAMGRNPRETARRFLKVIEGGSSDPGDLPDGGPKEAMQGAGVAKYRAERIARTETVRSYRSASLENYRANDDVVAGWEWSSALDSRTCIVCWAMHGTEHRLDEDMGSHPNCRCAQLPIIDPELGITQPARLTGSELFSRLPESRQVEILGQSKVAAYHAGEVSLSDFVGFRKDPDWGPTRWELSLADAKASAARRRAA